MVIDSTFIHPFLFGNAGRVQPYNHRVCSSGHQPPSLVRSKSHLVHITKIPLLLSLHRECQGFQEIYARSRNKDKIYIFIIINQNITYVKMKIKLHTTIFFIALSVSHHIFRYRNHRNMLFFNPLFLTFFHSVYVMLIAHISCFKTYYLCIYIQI